MQWITFCIEREDIELEESEGQVGVGLESFQWEEMAVSLKSFDNNFNNHCFYNSIF